MRLWSRFDSAERRNKSGLGHRHCSCAHFCSAAKRSRTSSIFRFHFSCMDARDLKFPNDSFDLILANSVLMWVDKSRLLRECLRVLKPGGRGLFTMETMAENPILKLHRLRTSKRHREKMVSRICVSDIPGLSEGFSQWRSWQSYLLSPILCPCICWKAESRTFQTAVEYLQKVDKFLLNRFTKLRRYAWVSVIELSK